MDTYRCWNHAIKDVKRKIIDLKIKPEDRKRYKKVVQYLISRHSKLKYLTSLNKLQLTWTSQFANYFQKNIDVDIEKLGWWSCQRFKMAKITTNQSESLNAVMKRLNDWTEVPIDAMATSLFQLTQSYVREIMRGRYLRGVDGYTLLPHLIPLYNLEKDKPILPPSDFHADVEAIVPKIMNAVKRSNDYIHTRSENEQRTNDNRRRRYVELRRIPPYHLCASNGGYRKSVAIFSRGKRKIHYQKQLTTFHSAAFSDNPMFLCRCKNWSLPSCVSMRN